MHQTNDKLVIGWLELAVATRWHGGIAALHAIEFGEHRSCYGVTVDQRWLCGLDGLLTLFDALPTAARFLQLLKVDRIAKGGRRECDQSSPDAFRCLKLGRTGLSPCTRCRGEAPCLHPRSTDVLDGRHWGGRKVERTEILLLDSVAEMHPRSLSGESSCQSNL
ncbi:MAG: hypothetical protein WCV99_08670 [Sterolibacterium sp.]|jgi:hypothetical protein